MTDAWELSDLRRRLANIVRPGVIDQLDTSNARVRVRAGEVLTGWLPWMTTRAMNDRSWWAPEPGEQVIVLSPSGELTNGYVLPAVFQQAGAPPGSSETVRAEEYANGTRVSHDREAQAYTIDVPAGGRITLKVGSTALVLEDGGTTLTTPNFTVDAADSEFTGNVTIKQLLTFLGGLNGSNGGSGAMSITGAVSVDGEVTANGIPVSTHDHQEGVGKPTA